jgi:hypothetical protein
MGSFQETYTLTFQFLVWRYFKLCDNSVYGRQGVLFCFGVYRGTLHLPVVLSTDYDESEGSKLKIGM